MLQQFQVKPLPVHDGHKHVQLLFLDLHQDDHDIIANLALPLLIRKVQDVLFLPLYKILGYFLHAPMYILIFQISFRDMLKTSILCIQFLGFSTNILLLLILNYGVFQQLLLCLYFLPSYLCNSLLIVGIAKVQLYYGFSFIYMYYCFLYWHLLKTSNFIKH